MILIFYRSIKHILKDIRVMQNIENSEIAPFSPKFSDGKPFVFLLLVYALAV